MIFPDRDTHPRLRGSKAGIMLMAAQQGRRQMLGDKLQGSRVRKASSLTFLALATCGFLSLWRLGGVKKSAVEISPRSTVVTATTVDSDVPMSSCPRCEDLFTRLDDDPLLHPYRGQEARIHLRGEPKVGWARKTQRISEMVSQRDRLLQERQQQLLKPCQFLHHSVVLGGCRLVTLIATRRNR